MSSQSDQPNELRSFNLPEVDAAIAGTQFAGVPRMRQPVSI